MRKLLPLSLLILIIAGCAGKANKKIAEVPHFCIPDSLFSSIKVDTIFYRPVINEFRLSGKVSYNQDEVVKIYPLVSGNVLDVKTSLGDYVNKGQVLAVIKSAEMAGFENDLITARSNLAVTEKNFAATEDMFKGGISSEKEYTAAQKELDKAHSELKRAETVLSIYGTDKQTDFIVKAPISGYIVEKFINPNMQIRADNSNNLFTISDLKSVWIMANVYETDISSIKLNEKASITTLAYPDKTFIGIIDKIYNVLDPDNKTLKIRIQLDNKEGLLKPEMFASVIVQEKLNKTLLAMPANSVVFDQNQFWAIIFNSKCDLEARKIEIFSSNRIYSYVNSGLKPGDKIISNLQLLIYNALKQ
jgi:membrane fusion protein, heavy metal efflux system